MTAQFAIVGSGPAGMYAADALNKLVPGCRVTVFEKFPSPFGLIRFGVAPDHYKTRNTARQFARALEADEVGYCGNVEVGRDISLDELRAHFDAVVLAVGAYNDRKLGITGEDLDGVYGACAFVGWYNGHPDYRDLEPRLDGPGVAVIGIGNVALDVCRVLAKTPAEMADSDICAHAAAAIDKAGYDNLYMFGRRGPLEAGFTPKELGELRELERCQVIVGGHQLPDTVPDDFDGRTKGIKEKNLKILHELAAQEKDHLPVKMRVEFYASPVEILGDERVEGLRLERTEVVDGRARGTGETFDVAVSAVVTAIGYHSIPPAELPMDGGKIANEGGRAADGVYVVGWAKRGPSGTIPTNGPDSREVAELIAAEVTTDGGKTGADGARALLAERGVRVVDFPAWSKIHEAEVARATGGHPRERFTSVDEMLAVLDGG